MKALEITNLTKTYRNGFKALKGVDLAIEQGDFFSLLGPNGAGKSTLINIVTSLVKPTDGEINIFGHNLKTELNAAKACIGLVPQEINLAIFESCEQILLQVAGYYGIRRKEAKQLAERYLKALDLWSKRDAQARMLSGGMRRRLMIARALMNRPKLLILDEPTAGVDIEIRRSMWDFLQEINQQQGTTIILTTHYLEEAEKLCRNLAMINHGKIVRQGAMKDFLSELNVETFVLDLEQEVTDISVLQEFSVKKLDSKTLEVEISEEQGLNKLFEVLTENKITVASMRNKANRLEELFLRLTQQPEVADE
ncbi:MAG: ABC transporter ATP-binding protein [Gammaproteobacteria bacterium]|nr:ABC transporter ATP-binding protein [Gammaproteobacteria bacterium]